MSNRFIAYLEREHARFEGAITVASRRLVPDAIEIARLKKLKLVIKDQIAACRCEQQPTEAV